jgi:hypothetical protein
LNHNSPKDISKEEGRWWPLTHYYALLSSSHITAGCLPCWAMALDALLVPGLILSVLVNEFQEALLCGYRKK